MQRKLLSTSCKHLGSSQQSDPSFLLPEFCGWAGGYIWYVISLWPAQVSSSGFFSPPSFLSTPSPFAGMVPEWGGEKGALRLCKHYPAAAKALLLSTPFLNTGLKCSGENQHCQPDHEFPMCQGGIIRVKQVLKINTWLYGLEFFSAYLNLVHWYLLNKSLLVVWCWWM